MRFSGLVTVLTLLYLFCLPAASRCQSLEARDIFAPYIGEWEGTFKIFSHDGKLLNILQVHQKYFWQNDTQKVHITDMYPDGKKEKSIGLNFARGDSLFCVVKHEDGKVVRLVGAHHGGRLIWHRQVPEQHLVESFKEYVAPLDGDTVYYIDGVGVYGSRKNRTILLFEGRYKKIN